MDERADSTSPPCEEASYRKRRRSYSAAMSEENSLDEDDDDEAEEEEEESYPHRDGATRARCCRRRECGARKISNAESESGWSTESFVSKRGTREFSGDMAKSWSEMEIPELLLAHPEILSRMMRCRCFVTQFSACRCAHCQYQCRKISSTSSCFAKESALLFQGAGAKRKDSGNSVSTCQTFLPPSSGRNSVGSLYHCCNDTGDNGTMTMTTTIPRRHSIAAGSIPYRRHLDQMYSLRNCKIDRADNRELFEQSLAGDTIRNCESVTGATSIAEPIIASKTRPRASLKTTTARATQSFATFHRDSSAPTDVKAQKDNESRIAGKSSARFTTSGKNAEANADAAFTARKNSTIPITPKMMRRRFSEQLILEGGLGSTGESENLVDQPEDVDDSLTARNARKKITLKRHYYPEGGWGYVIIIVTILVHIVSHGLQLASSLLISSTMTQFQQKVENAGMTYKILFNHLKINF